MSFKSKLIYFFDSVKNKLKSIGVKLKNIKLPIRKLQVTVTGIVAVSLIALIGIPLYVNIRESYAAQADSKSVLADTASVVEAIDEYDGSTDADVYTIDAVPDSELIANGWNENMSSDPSSDPDFDSGYIMWDEDDMHDSGESIVNGVELENTGLGMLLAHSDDLPEITKDDDIYEVLSKALADTDFGYTLFISDVHKNTVFAYCNRDTDTDNVYAVAQFFVDMAETVQALNLALRDGYVKGVVSYMLPLRRLVFAYNDGVSGVMPLHVVFELSDAYGSPFFMLDERFFSSAIWTDMSTLDGGLYRDGLSAFHSFGYSFDATVPQTLFQIGGVSEENSYVVGETFVFDGIEYTFGGEYEFVNIRSRANPHRNTAIVKVPVTVRNISREPHAPNPMYYRYYGPYGSVQPGLRNYFEDDLGLTRVMEPNEAYKRYVYFIGESNGDYFVEFSKPGEPAVEVHALWLNVQG